MEKFVYKIKGMTCASCSARVEKVVGSTGGVESCVVNLATERMTVEIDTSVLSKDDLEAAINKTGFGWSELKPQSGGTDMGTVLVSDKRVDTGDTGTVLLSEKQEKKPGSLFYKFNKKQEADILRIKFIISAIFAVPLLYIAMGHMLPFGWSLPLPQLLHHHNAPLNFALAQLILTIPIIAAGYRFYTVGFRAILYCSPNMDSLIALGTSAAVIYSLYATYRIFTGHPEYAEYLYYETAGVIITLVLLGKTLEAVSKGKTGEAIKKLMGLRPKTALVVRDGVETELPIEEVIVGDIVIIKPGGKIPVDGTVVEGTTSIDEAMLTGESMPVDKKPGDAVYAATINVNGFIKFKAEKIGADTTLAQIIKLVEDAQGSKAPIAKIADRVSGIFVPVVFCIAVIALFGWFIATRDVTFSLTIFISVLVIACPCALGLATPTAIMVGTGKGAEKGILIKSGEALETAHKIQTVVLDKTGTITEGKPEVIDIHVFDGAKQGDRYTVSNNETVYLSPCFALLQYAASAQTGSQHPLGEAIVRAAEKEGLPLLPMIDFESVAGKGIVCKVNGIEVIAGSEKFIAEMRPKQGDRYTVSNELKQCTCPPVSVPLSYADEGKTPVYVAIDGEVCGIIAIADTIKPSSIEAVKMLKDMNIDVVMITGDNKRTAAAIAEQVGISNVMAEVLPQDKAAAVKTLQNDGKKTAMAGDGINDSPALMQADIGIAIGSGTDVAIESADIVLMHSELTDVPAAIKLSKATMRNIKQNLFWAFGYNVLGIPIAAGVLFIFGGPLLSPMIAAAAMCLSSISVLTNALRLKRFKM
ncbi:MAG: heavy metal translocating P-type ATPase [Oscillospiraceae bacterium]|nr:heavy metal translocating P-type ATPase [Oscillospiraceae bacterium]